MTFASHPSVVFWVAFQRNEVAKQSC